MPRVNLLCAKHELGTRPSKRRRRVVSTHRRSALANTAEVNARTALFVALRIAARALLQQAAHAGSCALAASLGRRGALIRPGRIAPARRGARQPPQSSGTARTGRMVRRHGVDFARATRRDDRHHEIANRLDTTEPGRGAAHAGQNLGGDGGVWRFAKLQRRESNAHPRSLDAHAHHPQSVVGCSGVQRV